MEIVLGINWEQNSSAALIIDGVIFGCSSEERFTNIKNDESYPINAINWLISEAKIRKEDISRVAFISEFWSPTYSLIRHYTSFSIRDFITEQDLVWRKRIYDNEMVSALKVFEHKIDYQQFPGEGFWKLVFEELGNSSDHVSNTELLEIGKRIRRQVVARHLSISESQITFIDHHLGHGAYAYFSADTPAECLVLTLDAFGDFRNYCAYIANRNSKDGSISFEEVTSGNNFIVGRLYRYLTLVLNMKPNEHEYKVMGLAPYGKPEYARDVLSVLRNYQDVDGAKFRDINPPKDLFFQVKDDLIGCRFDAIATGLQTYTEELILKWVENLVIQTGISDVVLGGGVAMNVKANSLISKSPLIRNLYVPPSPDDSSQSMGAAYVANAWTGKDNNKISFKNSNAPIANAYLGRGFNSDYLKEVGTEFSLSNGYAIEEGGNEFAAKLLSEGSILGRFAGRAEFGARALGNRSILANPGDPSIKKVINEKIKNRDFWMPFAATVLHEYADEYLSIEVAKSSYAYMTNACATTSVGAKKLSAAIHPYDETCRPQILNKQMNPSYWDLIYAFGTHTGTFALLNTSLNFHGKPIVGDVVEALQLLKDSNLDGMLLDDFLIYKR